MGNLVQRNFWLNENFDSGLTLSERVTNLNLIDTVAETIRLNMEEAEGLTSLVSELSEYTTEEDLRTGIRELERVARRVIKGDLNSLQEFKSVLSREQRAIAENLSGGNASKLQKSYAKVVDAAAKLNSAGLDKAIEYAIDKKAESNAFRLAATEINKAYNKGVYSRALQDEDVVAMRLELTETEGTCEECEDLANADNGAGVGVYPLDNCPKTPIHPNCRCTLTEVYKLPDGADEDFEADGDFDKMEAMPSDVLDGEDE